MDLVRAIALGELTSLGQLHLVSANPATMWMNMPPLVVVPSFEVAIYLLLPSVSLRLVIEPRSAPPAWRRGCELLRRLFTVRLHQSVFETARATPAAGHLLPGGQGELVITRVLDTRRRRKPW